MARQKNTTRRIVVWTGILVACLVVVIAVGSFTGMFGGGDETVIVETDSVTVRTITQVVTASGKVQPEVMVKISSDVSGEIILLNVREGDQVRQGQLLARIDPKFYTAQAEQAQAGVLQARAALAQRQADLIRAEVDMNRQQELFQRQAVAEADYLTAKTQYDIAVAAHQSAEYGVQSAEARHRESIEQLNKTSIYAPMTGTVSQLNVELGERVVGTSQMAGTEMMQIALLEQMELMVDVNENDVVNVSLGDTAAIEIDSYPGRSFKGVVMEIANSARVSGAGTQDQVTNFPVKIRLLDVSGLAGPEDLAENVAQEEIPVTTPAPALLRPGMSGTVDIFTQTVSAAVAVPIQAVTVRDMNQVRRQQAEADSTANPVEALSNAPEREDLQEVVFLVRDGKAEVVQVETGVADETHIEITSGLQGGEIVIIGPYSAISRTLESGMMVQINTDTPANGAPLAAN
jgi:HlyD family secretion protein